MKHLPSVLLALPLFLAVSCLQQQQQQKKVKPEPKQEEKGEKDAQLPPLCLGAVHQVYPGEQFVLLRIIGPIPAAGTTLITHPADGSNSRIGNICVTTEKSVHNNGIIAADVRAGTVMRGDRVFLYRDIFSQKPKEEEDAPIPDQNAQEGEIEDIAPPIPPKKEGAPDNPNVVPDNEHPRIFHTPVNPDADNTPDYVPSESGDDTEIEQTPDPQDDWEEEPSVPLPNGSPGAPPSYLDDIPDTIDGWN